MNAFSRLEAWLKKEGKVAVAYSGGVDSAFLLKVALDTLGPDQVLAIIGDSDSLPRKELEEALELAESWGIRVRSIHSEEMQDPRYVENPPDRCYYCKHDLFSRIVALAAQEGIQTVIDGNNADDVGDYRPGQRAARELGVKSPLMEIAMTKREVREHSKRLGLPTADKPAAACLSSRIPYGSPITKEALSRIEAAEDFLKGEGFPLVRVRHHGDLARIEIAPDDIKKLLQADQRAKITVELKKIGYRYVSLDLQGYRMGSMNEGLERV